MSERPRDWDKELADIDKAIARHGSAPAPPGGPAAPVSPATRPVPGGGGPGVSRGGVVLTWFWVVLGVALAAALLLWPYDKSCGLQLSFYLGAAGTTAVFAVLGAVSAWTHRRALAHVLSLIVLGWAGVAAAHEILPRTGYAKESRTWLCPAPPATPPVQAPSPAPAR
jgi:putative solute:sodium symporter small subunit